jgi:hypothetical protein
VNTGLLEVIIAATAVAAAAVGILTAVAAKRSVRAHRSDDEHEQQHMPPAHGSPAAWGRFGSTGSRHRQYVRVAAAVIATALLAAIVFRMLLVDRDSGGLGAIKVDVTTPTASSTAAATDGPSHDPGESTAPRPTAVTIDDFDTATCGSDSAWAADRPVINRVAFLEGFSCTGTLGEAEPSGEIVFAAVDLTVPDRVDAFSAYVGPLDNASAVGVTMTLDVFDANGEPLIDPVTLQYGVVSPITVEVSGVERFVLAYSVDRGEASPGTVLGVGLADPEWR